MTVEVPDWLNVQFVQKILKNSENDESIEVTNLITESVVDKGDNYGSIMICAKVNYSHIESSHRTMRNKSMVFKIAPTVEGTQKELIDKMKVFQTEIKIMTSVLSKMRELLNDDECHLSARIFYTRIEEPSLLVMEDLRTLGYRMADRQTGLDLDHCLLAIKGLAKFHASSVALFEKDPEVKTSFKSGIFSSDQPDEWKKFLSTGLKNIGNEILNWTELGPCAKMYSEKLLKLSEVSYDKASKCCESKDDDFNVINHGDCWINNMLFRYDENGKVNGHIFVDFQLCNWTSPAIDLWNFLNTSISEDVDLHHRDTLLNEYLSTLTTTMKRIGCLRRPLSISELKKILMEREFHGMVCSFVMLPLILLDKDDALNFDELMDPSSGNISIIYKRPAYRKLIIRKIPEWNVRGLIDV